MNTATLSTSYNLKWQFIFDSKYKVSECRKIINTHTNRLLHERLNGYSLGYWFGNKFIRTCDLNKYVEVIPNYKLPF